MKQTLKRQKGITLMEIIAGLLIIGLVVGGALSLFGNADSSQKGTRMLSDLTAVRANVKGLYTGQGGYGTVNINGILKTSNKIPSTWTADAATPPVITHTMNGTITVTGVSTQFKIDATNIPTDVCVQLLTNATSGWDSIKVGASTISTFPITPAIAASTTNCAASNSNTLTFTSS